MTGDCLTHTHIHLIYVDRRRGVVTVNGYHLHLMLWRRKLFTWMVYVWLKLTVFNLMNCAMKLTDIPLFFSIKMDEE